MNIKQSIINKIEKTETGKRFIEEQRSRIILAAVCSFSINLLYAFYNGILGIINQSVWFVTMCAYYIILSTMRLCAVLCERKNRNTPSGDIEYFVNKFCGILFVFLDFAWFFPSCEAYLCSLESEKYNCAYQKVESTWLCFTAKHNCYFA